MIRLRATLRILTAMPGDLLLMLVTWLPGPSGTALRRRYWSRRLGHLGVGTRIDTGVIFQNPSFIHIGDNCWIDRNVTVLAGTDQATREKRYIANEDYLGTPGVVRIGNNVHVGADAIISGIDAGICVGDDCTFSAGCRLFAFTHHYRSFAQPHDARFSFGSCVESARQALLTGPISLANNCGLALGCVVLPGVSLGANSFAGIACVIHQGRYPANSLLKGNPARIVRARFAPPK
jgi:acetyltransferase-like isoleucine patch superfamily enzyme